MAAPTRPSRGGAAMARLETAVRCHVTSLLTRAGDGDGGRRPAVTSGGGARGNRQSFLRRVGGRRASGTVEGLFDFVYIRVRCFAGRRCVALFWEPLERSEGGGEALASEVKDVGSSGATRGCAAPGAGDDALVAAAGETQAASHHGPRPRPGRTCPQNQLCCRL